MLGLIPKEIVDNNIHQILYVESKNRDFSNPSPKPTFF